MFDKVWYNYVPSGQLQTKTVKKYKFKTDLKLRTSLGVWSSSLPPVIYLIENPTFIVLAENLKRKIF